MTSVHSRENHHATQRRHADAGNGAARALRRRVMTTCGIAGPCLLLMIGFGLGVLAVGTLMTSRY